VTLRHQQSTGSPLLATMAQPLAPPHSGQRDAPADVADAASKPGVDIEFKMADLSRITARCPVGPASHEVACRRDGRRRSAGTRRLCRQSFGHASDGGGFGWTARVGHPGAIR
jgi:hypothetical protein